MTAVAAEPAQSWEMSSLVRVSLAADAELSELPGPRWVYVRSGAVRLETAAETVLLAAGDAALVDARTAHRVLGADDTRPSELTVADLRVTVAAYPMPAPLVVCDFAARNRGVAALVELCPLQVARTIELFVQSYGSLIAAAMTASWLDDRGPRDDEDSGAARWAGDPAVAAVIDAVSARPHESWTVDRMARLVHVSRSSLGERFRRTVGRGPAQVLRELRMREARRLLAEPSRPVEYVASRVGYGSTAAFSRAFSAVHGRAPQAWRAGH